MAESVSFEESASSLYNKSLKMLKFYEALLSLEKTYTSSIGSIRSTQSSGRESLRGSWGTDQVRQNFDNYLDNSFLAGIQSIENDMINGGFYKIRQAAKELCTNISDCYYLRKEINEKKESRRIALNSDEEAVAESLAGEINTLEGNLREKISITNNNFNTLSTAEFEKDATGEPPAETATGDIVADMPLEAGNTITIDGVEYTFYGEARDLVDGDKTWYMFVDANGNLYRYDSEGFRPEGVTLKEWQVNWQIDNGASADDYWRVDKSATISEEEVQFIKSSVEDKENSSDGTNDTGKENTGTQNPTEKPSKPSERQYQAYEAEGVPEGVVVQSTYEVEVDGEMQTMNLLVNTKTGNIVYGNEDVGYLVQCISEDHRSVYYAEAKTDDLSVLAGTITDNHENYGSSGWGLYSPESYGINKELAPLPMDNYRVGTMEINGSNVQIILPFSSEYSRGPDSLCSSITDDRSVLYNFDGENE